MYDRILYPTDGSEGAATALDTVQDLAETYDAAVDVLHVTEHLNTHGLAGGTEVTGTGGLGSGIGAESGLIGSGSRCQNGYFSPTPTFLKWLLPY